MRSVPSEWKRCPRVSLPARASRMVAGNTSLPSSSTSQCTGRTNCASPAPQRMRFGMGRASSASVTKPGSRSRAAAPGFTPVKLRHSLPLGSVSRPSASMATPQLCAKASAARVGLPLLSKAAATGGPRRWIFCSGCVSASCARAPPGDAAWRMASHRAMRKAGGIEARHEAIAEGFGQRAAAPSAAALRCRVRPANPRAAHAVAACAFSIGKPSASRLA